MKLRIGQTISLQIAGIEQVELLDELGSGGNGHVWKVRPISPPSQTYYALKHIEISPDLSPEEHDDYLHRIRCEASVNVASEYIIRCLGLRELEPDNFVFLFPYTPGQDLDAWFVGFTTHLCAGIWVGNDDNRPMDRISGGTLPVDIFREFMRRTHEYLHLAPQPLP